MLIGKVEGTVVCSVKDQAFQGIKLLVVRLMDDGKRAVAGDATRQAGEGDLVTLVGSKEASLIFGDVHPPCDLAITGFVDTMYPENIWQAV